MTPWLTKLHYHVEEEIVCLQDSQKIMLDRAVNSNRMEILELLSSCLHDLNRFDKKMQQLWAKLVDRQEENPMDFCSMNLMTCDIVSLAVRCILYVLSSNKNGGLWESHTGLKRLPSWSWRKWSTFSWRSLLSRDPACQENRADYFHPPTSAFLSCFLLSKCTWGVIDFSVGMEHSTIASYHLVL